MDEWMMTLDAEPVSAQAAAVWAASILKDSTIDDALILLTSLATFEHVSGPAHPLAASNARALRGALVTAVRPMMN
jgi:hypothetical protein